MSYKKQGVYSKLNEGYTSILPVKGKTYENHIKNNPINQYFYQRPVIEIGPRKAPRINAIRPVVEVSSDICKKYFFL